MSADQPLLQLSPQEKTAYSYLFNLADTDSLGVITGERAVSFFEKTHVPAPALGEIWQIADTENRGLLTKPGFCMVVRLIGWYQNGQQTPTTELAFKPGPIPKFDGITLPSPPPPQQQQSTASPTTGGFPQNALQPQLSGQNPAGAPIRVPPLDPTKVQQYSGLFERSGAQNGQLDGGTAKSIFERAGLPNEMLGKIWMLSDGQQRGALDETEFIVAMHLLTSMKTRTMTALPNTLPPGLYEAAARRGQRPPSRQMSAAPTPVPRQLTGQSTQPRTQSPLARPPGYGTPPPQSAQPTGPQWLVTPQDKANYDRHFAEIDKAGRGVISGDQAVEFFSNSSLDEDTLASIWDLADINSEGQLNKDEFAVAMYLIRQQRVQGAPPLPAFLSPALIPPSMRRQQQPSAAASSAFDQLPTVQAPKSASEDLFGLDSSPTQTQAPQASLQSQGTGASASRDPFGGSGPSSPSSPAIFATPQQSTGSTTFKQFVPTSAFGASLASHDTGASTTSSQGQARGFPAQQQGPKAPSTMDDLLGDNEAHTAESSRLTNDTTELANMSNQIGNLRTQMESTQTKKAATQADMTASSNQKRDLEQRLQQFRAQYESEAKGVKEMEQQLAASRDSTKKLGQELAMIEGSHQDLQTQHNAINQQLQADQQENSSLKQKISQLNAEIAQLKPAIEKLKLDARQQKGLVSINKKQLATNEAERDRLQSEKADLERDAAEHARSVAASPEPVLTSQASNVVSPAASTISTNPFFRKASEGASAVTSPAAVGSAGPTPSAFDAIFGPSTAYAPTGQASSRTGTPPATSFIGRSMPAAAAVGVGAAAIGATAVGGAALAESMSSHGDLTPAATPPVGSAMESPLETPASAAAAPPPPPESRQFTPTNLPLGGSVVGADGKADSDAASSTQVIPPASRAGGVETPRDLASSPVPFSTSSAFDAPTTGEGDRETIPGAFPDDELQPSISAQEIPHSSGAATPAAKPTDDFESAFASFGEDEKAKEATSADDPFAPGPSQTSQARGFDEFPPIRSLDEDEDDDSSDGEDEEPAKTGFDDSFTTPPRNGVASNTLQPVSSAAVASGSEIAAARPGLKSVESTASDLPPINKEMSPPTYEQSDDLAHGGSGERSSSNQFPPEFGDLLPSREDPTSPPPPSSTPPALADEQSMSKAATNDTPALTFAAPQPQEVNSLQPSSILRESVTTPSTDIFVDASSRPMSSITEAAPDASHTQTAGPKSAFDDFDDFADLSEAKEADKTGSDYDYGFGRQSVDEFNPAFDSPAPSQSQTPTPMNRSVQQPTESNGFANFAPNVSSSSNNSAFGSGSGNGSIQSTPQNVQHDWDQIFSGLDSSKNVDTSLNSTDPWGTGASSAATTNGNGAATKADSEIYAPPPGPPPGRKAAAIEMGRAITPGTEHDDPILKRLTGMGYSRATALEALEKYDYDINKVCSLCKLGGS